MSRFVLVTALAFLLPACGPSGGGSRSAAPDGSPEPGPTPEPTPDAAAAPTRPGLAGPASFASVTEGVAPLGVVFSAVETSLNDGQALARPADGDYSTFRYAWDFGDPASGVWPTSHRGRNSDSGFCAAHVYERPGTYVCRLTLTDAEGVEHTYAQTIQVAAFTGPTYHVSTSGDDAASGLSEAAPWRTVSKVLANLAPNRRFLFRRGDTFTAPEMLSLEPAGPAILGAYGPSTSPRPLLRFRGSGIMIYGDDWRVADLELEGPAGDSTGLSLSSSGGLRRALLLRVATRGFGVGIGWSLIDGAPADDAIVVAGCESTGAGVNGFFVGARRLALLGNTVTDPEISHCVRVWQANRSVVAHNVCLRPGGDRHALKLHGPKTSEPGPPSEYVVVSSNRFQGNLLTVVVAPQNAVSDEPVSHVLIERNRTLSVPMTQSDYVIEARDVTIRNNVMDGSLAAGSFCGVAVQAGGVVRSPGRIRIENNTMYRGSPGVDARMAIVESGAFEVALRNNLASFPRVASPARSVLLGGHPGIVVENNLLSDVPGFADGAGGDFHLAPGSPALGAATPSARVRDDYDGLPRPAGAGRDLGAYER